MHINDEITHNLSLSYRTWIVTKNKKCNNQVGDISPDNWINFFDQMMYS